MKHNKANKKNDANNTKNIEIDNNNDFNDSLLEKNIKVDNNSTKKKIKKEETIIKQEEKIEVKIIIINIIIYYFLLIQVEEKDENTFDTPSKENPNNQQIDNKDEINENISDNDEDSKSQIDSEKETEKKTFNIGAPHFQFQSQHDRIDTIIAVNLSVAGTLKQTTNSIIICGQNCKENVFVINVRTNGQKEDLLNFLKEK